MKRTLLILPRLLQYVTLLTILLASSALNSRPAQAAPQPPGSLLASFPQTLRFETLSLDQGLSQSAVTAILQDRQGFMWFGTQDGLNRYDGSRFQVFKPDPDLAGSLPGQYIGALTDDPNGDLWIATSSSGLGRLIRATGKFEPISPAALSSGASVLLVDRQGRLWVGTYKGLARFDPSSGQVTRYQADPQNPAPLSSDRITALAEDRQGILWVGTSDGLNRLDPTSGSVLQYLADSKNPAALSSGVIRALYIDHAGVLWIGTEEGGLNRLDPVSGQFTRYTNDPHNPLSLGNNTVTAILEDHLGELWIGTSGGGLNHMDREQGAFEVYRNTPGDPTSLSADFILSLYEDRSGILWIGTEGGGVNKLSLQPETFTHVRVGSADAGSRQVNRDLIWSLLQDGSGRLYVGTNGGGLSRFDPQTRQWQHFGYNPDDFDSLSGDVILALAPAPNGKLWAAAAHKGLNLFDPNTGKAVRYRMDPDDPTGLSSDYILTLMTDHSGRLWIGTADMGLDLFDPLSGRFTHFRAHPTDPNSLASSTIRGITEGRDGTIWVSSEGGLAALDPLNGQVQRYLADPAKPGSLSSNSPISVFEDRQGIFWIATVGGGLNRFDRKSGIFKVYREKDGLPNNVVYGMLEDAAGDLWLSTNNGLARFDPRSEVFTSYGVQDGLQSREFNNNAFFKNAQGLMFFGGVNGFNVFDPAHLDPGNPYVPPVALTALTHAGQPLFPNRPVESIDQITLTWPDNSFEFEFVALNYIHAERNRYAYQLENFDKDWIQSDTRRFGQYTNLPGGSYTLRLKAANNSGVWNNVGLSIQVTVVPPFWQTLWFAALVVLLCGAALYSGVRLRVRSTEQRARQLRTLVEERTRDLEERNREVARRAEQFHVINDVGHQITSILDTRQLLNEIVATIQQAFGYDLVTIGLVEGPELVFRAAAGLDGKPLALPALHLPVSSPSIAAGVAASGEARMVADVTREPDYLPWPAGVQTCSEMALPLKTQSGVIGVLNVESSHASAFDESDRLALQALANQVAIAFENARLYEQSRQTAVAQERNRLARELHDAVTQTLFSASLLAEALPTAWEKDPREGRELLDELRSLSRGALAEMRTLLLELRPSVLAESNLEDLLRQLAEAMIGREGIKVKLAIDGKASLPGDVRIAFYRIAQEALNNVVKHARASQVAISLHYLAPDPASPDGRCQPCGAVLEVQDNGRGFETTRASSNHLGLGIMLERAQTIGGTLAVESSPGKGTRVSVTWEDSKEEK